nr:sodium-dependent organic anion transporter-like [Lytechinus pictus]
MATTTEAMATVATTTRTTTTESMMSTAIGITTEVLTTIARSNSTGSDCDHRGDGGHANDGGHKNIEELKLANQCVLGITLGLTMVAMGAAIDVKDFKIVLRRPVGVAVGFLCQVVLMPLIGFIMAVVLNLEAPYALGVLIVSSCPGGTTSNLYTFWTNGDICLSAAATITATITATIRPPSGRHPPTIPCHRLDLAFLRQRLLDPPPSPDSSKFFLLRQT